MDFITQISPLVENIGFPALVFAIWYIYHQSQVKAFETIIQDNFEILKDLLETNQELKVKSTTTSGVRF